MSDGTGQRIGDYEIIRELGHGGMGKVYLARNVLSDRVEALKVLLPDLAGRSDFVNRFMREIKMLASLDHPNIARLSGAFSVGDQFVMVMEYVDGVTLSDLLEKGAFSAPVAVDYTCQALSALNYAHGKHVIHRDIKPGNMMLTKDGTVKLMDFGLARSVDDVGMTMTSATLGSLDYASPEQVQSHPTDERSDLYSVGVSLYQMVTGKRMFSATSSFSIMQAQISETPRPPIEIVPTLPKPLNEVIVKAVAKDPAQRFQSADEFRNALSGITGNAAQSMSASAAVTSAGTAALTAPAARRGDPGFVPTPSESHNGRNLGILAAVVVLAALVGAGMLYRSRQPKDVTAASATTIAPAPAPTATAASTATATTSAPPSAQVEPSQQAAPPTPPPPTTVAHSGHPQPAIPPAPSGPTPQEIAAQQQAELEHKKLLDEMETEIDHLDARAATVESTLDTLEQSLHQQGLGLRGDMVSARANLRTDMSKAKQAMDSGDTDRAHHFIEMANREMEKLEAFVGRR